MDLEVKKKNEKAAAQLHFEVELRRLLSSSSIGLAQSGLGQHGHVSRQGTAEQLSLAVRRCRPTLTEKACKHPNLSLALALPEKHSDPSKVTWLLPQDQLSLS